MMMGFGQRRNPLQGHLSFFNHYRSTGLGKLVRSFLSRQAYINVSPHSSTTVVSLSSSSSSSFPSPVFWWEKGNREREKGTSLHFYTLPCFRIHCSWSSLTLAPHSFGFHICRNLAIICSEKRETESSEYLANLSNPRMYIEIFLG